MKKYENTNFRVSAPEIVGIILFACLLAATVFFYKSYSDVKDLFNIEKTEVDFIITAPSSEQVSEISNMGHIERMVPYYYRSVTVSAKKGNVTSSLFVVDDANDIPYTTLSESLLVERDSADVANPLYITEDFAKSTGLGVADSVQISIDGTDLSFTVVGVYKSDHRHVGGTIIAVKTNDVSSAMKSAKYAGAFVASNNLTETGNYLLNEYVPMGDLRSRDEFDSDDAYQTYLDTREQSDTTKETFVTSDYVKELSRRNNGKLLKNIIIAIACAACAYLVIVLIMTLRTNGYTKANVLRDIKDNFTIDQETRMYRKYFSSFGVLMILINAVAIVIPHFLGWINYLSIINIAEVCATLVVLVVVGCAAINKLKQRFLVENKKYEEEKRKAQGTGK